MEIHSQVMGSSSPMLKGTLIIRKSSWTVVLRVLYFTALAEKANVTRTNEDKLRANMATFVKGKFIPCHSFS